MDSVSLANRFIDALRESESDTMDADAYLQLLTTNQHEISGALTILSIDNIEVRRIRRSGIDFEFELKS